MQGNDSEKVNEDHRTRDPAKFESEADLVEALRRNDSAAYEILIKQFAGRMRSAARLYLFNEHDCTDAVQDAFISVFKSIKKFEGNSKLGTWLHRIVINVCLMKLRSRSRRHEVPIEELIPTFDASGHHERPARRWKTVSDEALQRIENRAVIRQCIEMLPDGYREVVLLRDIEGFSTEETAKALNTTIGAVKTRLHRARQALRTLLEPHFAR